VKSALQMSSVGVPFWLSVTLTDDWQFSSVNEWRLLLLLRSRLLQLLLE
jgi:hypothetical protein